MSVCVCVFSHQEHLTYNNTEVSDLSPHDSFALVPLPTTRTKHVCSPIGFTSYFCLAQTTCLFSDSKYDNLWLVPVVVRFYGLNKPTVKESCGHRGVNAVNQCVYSSVPCCNSSLIHNKQPICVKGTGGLCFNNSINCKSKSHLLQQHYAERWFGYSVSPIIKHATPYSVLCV